MSEPEYTSSQFAPASSEPSFVLSGTKRPNSAALRTVQGASTTTHASSTSA
jgi:hypothetical protein